MDESPIYHYHVKTTKKRQDSEGQWYAYFLEPDGEGTWMSQPIEPTIGEEQTLYVLKKDTPEWQEFEILIARGISKKNMEEYIRRIAKQYDVWCEKSWEEARSNYMQQNSLNWMN